MLKRTVALMLCILSVFTLLPAFSSAQTLSAAGPARWITTIPTPTNIQ